jgi:hypothetical protein
MQHIEETTHKQHLRSNKFSKLILETELKLKQPLLALKPALPFLETKLLLDETNEPDKAGKRIEMHYN